MPMTDDQLFSLNLDLYQRALQIALHGSESDYYEAPRSRGVRASVDFKTREIVITHPTRDVQRIPADGFKELHIITQRRNGYSISWERQADGSYLRTTR